MTKAHLLHLKIHSQVPVWTKEFHDYVSSITPTDTLSSLSLVGMAMSEFGTGHPNPIPVPKYLVISHPVPNPGRGIPIPVIELKLKSHPRPILTRVYLIKAGRDRAGLGLLMKPNSCKISFFNKNNCRAFEDTC